MSKIVELIDEHHRKNTDTQRGHMGGSILGHKCERYLWYMFRWTFKEHFSGRMRRLFRRGQLEERVIVADLRAIGIDIREVGNNQAKVDFGTHISGSVDGIIVKGVPGILTKSLLPSSRRTTKDLLTWLRERASRNPSQCITRRCRST